MQLQRNRKGNRTELNVKRKEDGEDNERQQRHVEYKETITRHAAVVNCVKFSPDGSMLASCGDRGEAFVFEKRKEEDEVQKMDVDVRIVDSSKCESGENKRGGEEEEAQSMFSCKWTLRGGTADALDLTWSADSQLVAVSYIDWRTIIYDVANGGLPLIAFEGKRGKGVLGASSGNGHTSFVQGVAFDTLSKWIVSVLSLIHI